VLGLVFGDLVLEAGLFVFVFVEVAPYVEEFEAASVCGGYFGYSRCGYSDQISVFVSQLFDLWYVVPFVDRVEANFAV